MLEGVRLDHRHGVRRAGRRCHLAKSLGTLVVVVPAKPSKAKDATWHSENDRLFEDKMRRLAAEWREHVTEARRLDTAIEANLRSLGMIDYGRFRLSLARLQEQYANYCQLDPSLPEVTQDAVAESVLRRFKMCYDCMWKTLKRYLVEELGVADAPNSPKPILRLAFENYLLASSLERWLTYAEHRVGTSHDYSLSKADDCLAATGDFIADATALYETMPEHDGTKRRD